MIFLFYLSILVIRRRSDDRLSKLFLGLNLSISIGLIINMIYASFMDPVLEDFATLLSIISVFFLNLSSVFMILFMASLYSPRIYNNWKIQVLSIFAYGFTLSGMFFIQDGVIIEIKDGIQLSPVWNFSFFLFNTIILSFSYILIMLIAYKNYKRFKSKKLKKKIGYLIKGTFLYFFIMFSLGVFNFLNLLFLRMIYIGFGTLIFFASLYFYKGIGVSLKASFEEIFNNDDN